jgi:hypothetical protein
MDFWIVTGQDKDWTDLKIVVRARKPQDALAYVRKSREMGGLRWLQVHTTRWKDDVLVMGAPAAGRWESTLY